MQQRTALPFRQPGPDDDVGVTGFILQGHENDAGAARVLTADHDTGGARHAPVRQRAHGRGGKPLQAIKPRTQQRQGMTAQGQPDTGVVGNDVFAFGGPAQQGHGFRNRGLRQQGQGRLHAGNRPACPVAVAGEACQRVMALAHQIHGAIGVTIDHDLQYYTRRAKAAEVTFGDASFHREVVAKEMGL